jgi:hypothetical protein
VLEKMMLRCVLNPGLFLLVTYNQLHPTEKRRKKKQATRELEEKLREIGGLKQAEPSMGDLGGEVERLKRKLQQLKSLNAH